MTVSVALLSAATAAVLASLPTRSVVWLALGSLLAVALAWGALRVLWTEVLEARRENAADRAAAASAYRNLFAVRAGEHAEFATAMTERLAQAHLAQREMEGLIVQHETRAQRAESRLATEVEAHGTTRARVQELEQALVSLQADGSVVDLAAWDEQVQKTAAAKSARPRKRA